MSKRTEKVAKMARQVLGEAIQELKDPRVGFVTITAVRVTPDLRSIRVFVGVLGDDDEQKSSMAGIKSATPHLRTVLGQEVRLRFLPELTFELDTVPQEAERLESLFRQIHAGEGPSDDEA
jgi:ribosome-binding factor A